VQISASASGCCSRRSSESLVSLAVALLLTTAVATAAQGDEPATDAAKTPVPPPAGSSISYDRDVLPIFRRSCFGCHQNGKRQGNYRMTQFASLLAGGESEQPAIVPGDPAASYLLEQITPQDGHAAMPQVPAAPLSATEIETIRDWIAQGAVNDSKVRGPSYDAEHPPVYHNAPVITSIDISHDGRLIAAAAYHEVILCDAESGEPLARLVGLSPRINSVRFSPDSTRLSVAAGTPAEAGELQVWDVATRQLQLSLPLGSDTLSGVCWSPDGSKISLGSSNIVRALDANSGEEVLFQGAHEDWVLDTAFTADGSHLVSVARDMTCKLTEVATQRFIDNVTSITPGALAGGLNAIVRHPTRNEIFVGGADGVAKVYQVFRTTARKIGDDDNLIRALPAMNGRIFSVAVSPDGTRLAAAATIDGGSEIRVWHYNFGGATPERIVELAARKPEELSEAERQSLAEYRQREATEIWRSTLADNAIYAIRFAPDQSLLAAGNTGQLHRFSSTGEPLDAWPVVPIAAPSSDSPAAPPLDVAQWMRSDTRSATDQASEPTIEVDAIVRLETTPSAISLLGPLAYTQMIVTATLADGSAVDVTRWCEVQPSEIVAANSRLLVRPLADGQGEFVLRLGKHTVHVPVSVSGLQQAWLVDFIRDVNPVLSRLGCNQGSCHGAQDGKNGFKLSLRGYDPIFDIRSLTDDHAARRINSAAPDESLMLRKPLGLSPHQGGTLMSEGDPYHSILRRWIADGSKLDLQSPRVSRIEITPSDPVVNSIGSRQQVRVVAYYADGAERDVTHEAFITSGNTEVADVDSSGLLTTVRRGEAPILARYEGAYAATTLTVMGQREGFQWTRPPSWNRIDDLVATKWERLRILPSDLCSDEEFLRRVHLDLTGLPPTSDEIRDFVADPTETQQKRAEVIDRLIGSEAFIEFWTNKWADLLQVNRKFLGPEGSLAYRRAAPTESIHRRLIIKFSAILTRSWRTRRTCS
jgi:mono/diheme cytochrome c family protein